MGLFCFYPLVAQQTTAAPAQTPDTPPATAPATPAPSAQPAPAAEQTAPAAETAAPVKPQADVPAATPPAAAADTQGGAITEDQLKQLLLGKPLYLRGGYLDSSISFNEHGVVTGHPAQGSYTLSGVEIEKIRLTKHKVELLGARYGLHFLGGLPYEDPTKAVDRVRITPNKKVLRITIDREIVVKPKKVKEKGKAKPGKQSPAKPTTPVAVTAAAVSAATPVTPMATDATEIPTAPTPVVGTASSAAAAPPLAAVPAAAPDAAPATTAVAQAPASTTAGIQPTAAAKTDKDNEKTEPDEPSEADQLKASIAAAPEAEKPADPNSVTTTISPAHATQVLKEALDKIFAPGLDERMMASMPKFWKLYYQAAAVKSDYRPSDPAVLRQNTVDKKARLVTNFEPASNEFAQAAAVAGMALYHTVIGPDGKPGEIAVARPIGFGLDENAVEAIRNARFEPAMKNGKAVPVLLDLVVQFRIFSKRTAVTDTPTPVDKTDSAPQPARTVAPALPGPYSRQP
jgi:TonB family protein